MCHITFALKYLYSISKIKHFTIKIHQKKDSDLTRPTRFSIKYIN
jgi:hypothetical protein